MPLPKCGAHADWCTRSRLRAHDSLDLGALRAVNRRTDCEAVAALEAIIEPLVQHDVAQPAIAEIACELRANRLEHRMAMPARARLDFREPRVMVDADLQIRIRDGSARLVEQIGQRKRRRIPTPLARHEMQRAVAIDFRDERTAYAQQVRHEPREPDVVALVQGHQTDEATRTRAPAHRAIRVVCVRFIDHEPNIAQQFCSAPAGMRLASRPLATCGRWACMRVCVYTCRRQNAVCSTLLRLLLYTSTCSSIPLPHQYAILRGERVIRGERERMRLRERFQRSIIADAHVRVAGLERFVERSIRLARELS